MAIKVSDTKHQAGVEERNGQLWVVPQPFLYCTKCGAEYSANAGDYFASDPDHVFRCCRRNMLLVTSHRVLEEVS